MMWQANPKQQIANEVPWSDNLTAYDRDHFTIYMGLLDASADGACEDEMARLILGIDPLAEPKRARKAVRSHLERASWMVTTGYKDLFAP